MIDFDEKFGDEESLWKDGAEECHWQSTTAAKCSMWWSSATNQWEWWLSDHNH